MKINFNNVNFIKSAASEGGFIRDGRPKICFAGRSNVGKSSVINRLLGRRNFARVATTPGKTAHVNYFDVDGRVYFADLPGYGYAKVSKTERGRWAVLMEKYFADPENVTLGLLIVDSRHKPTADDQVMSRFFLDTGARFAVVANKLDKLKKSEIERNLSVIRETLALPGDIRVVPFSAEKGTGREELTGLIMSLGEEK